MKKFMLVLVAIATVFAIGFNAYDVVQTSHVQYVDVPYAIMIGSLGWFVIGFMLAMMIELGMTSKA